MLICFTALNMPSQPELARLVSASAKRSVKEVPFKLANALLRNGLNSNVLVLKLISRRLRYGITLFHYNQVECWDKGLSKVDCNKL